eukprot:scaffold11388_cov124-Isochrysis_galbana.AAC.1
MQYWHVRTFRPETAPKHERPDDCHAFLPSALASRTMREHDPNVAVTTIISSFCFLAKLTARTCRVRTTQLHATQRADVASAVFSIFILYLGAAKNKPITVTDVQSDGRPLALPRDPDRAATCMRCGGCRVRFAMTDPFYNNGWTTICPTSTRARSWSRVSASGAAWQAARERC